MAGHLQIVGDTKRALGPCGGTGLALTSVSFVARDLALGTNKEAKARLHATDPTHSTISQPLLSCVYQDMNSDDHHMTSGQDEEERSQGHWCGKPGHRRLGIEDDA